MILGTLGSDKSVTTVDAIMTEIFTGLKPNEIRIYREEPNSKQDFPTYMKDALKILNIEAEIKDVVLGSGILEWKNKISNEKINVLDITPGRKYMAIIGGNYIKADEVRYAYLKNERKGYHVFGYVPLSEIKVYNIRDGRKIGYDPPLTKKCEGEECVSSLDSEGLTALYNLLSMHGKIDVRFGDESIFDLTRDNNLEDEYFDNCMIRSGFKRFEEERKIENTEGFFIADTNVYIKLGNRLGYLTKGRLLASKSVYNELMEKTKNTQKQGNAILFYQGMYSYRSLHKNPPVSDYNRTGDIPLIQEARKIKENIPEKLTIITADKQLSYSALSQGVNVIFLHNLRNNSEGPEKSGNIGELLLCASYRREYTSEYDREKKDLILTINDKEILKIEPSSPYNGFSIIKTLNKEFNYAKLIEKLYKIISQ
ncbi:hypothetical protein DFR86_10940 [Acidianus sulfidivorans JP7]|uniref:Uncharacterized protein n=1 Tax=Acidianus sulfidivorans JP7 TaxID=619593 RepID=A0A2U9IPN4_9CREN|nr:PIN domain-containing protein [Acidianus sulfidivorans]AWR98000.1 hypothetical protein DFR86_10940 [Acidianus sulfidivorans JP7]